MTTTDWEGAILAGGRYAIKKKLGRGGMSVVYLAHNRVLDAEVAIKVPNEELLKSSSFAFRFPREIRSLVKLSHPRIVKIYDVGEHFGRPFMVMQYLSGGTLARRRLFDPEGKPCAMPTDSIRDWLEPIADALDFIHDHGYIHRDVKPGNVLFDGYGHAFLSDFGLAKALEPEIDSSSEVEHEPLENLEAEPPTLVKPTPFAEVEPETKAGAIVGTLPYMAPEILLRRPYDGQADQYSLAVIVYEMLSGHWPVKAPSYLPMMHMHLEGKFRPLTQYRPDLPDSLIEIVHRGLSKKPADRYPKCSVFAKEVLKAFDLISESSRQSSSSSSPKTPDRIGECPQCGTQFRLFAALSGRKIRCAECKISLRVSPQLELLIEDQERAIESETNSEPEASISIRVEPLSIKEPESDQEDSSTVTSGWRRILAPLTTFIVAGLFAGYLIYQIGFPPDDPEGPLGDPNGTVKAEQIQGEPVEPTSVQPLHKLFPTTETNSLGMELILVEPGAFPMGASDGEKGMRANERPRRQIAISRPFYLAKFETTVGQFRRYIESAKVRTWAERVGGFTNEDVNRLVGQRDAQGNMKLNWRNSGLAKQTDLHPALFIDWDAAVEFCEWLSQEEGARYRLPTEAEWEYACRAGTTGAWSFGDDSQSLADYAKLKDDKPTGPLTVGSLKPNPWGFYDMHGNAAEWCLDAYVEKYQEFLPRPDPLKQQTNAYRVLRGGSFADAQAERSRSAFRDHRVPNAYGVEFAGFRILREVGPKRPVKEIRVSAPRS